MSSRRKRNLLLRKPLYPIPHNINTTLITRIQLQDSLLVCIAQHLSRKTQDRGCLSDTRHTRDNKVGHVSILGDDFESFDGFGVADDVV
jgi:hypothetical protein